MSDELKRSDSEVRCRWMKKTIHLVYENIYQIGKSSYIGVAHGFDLNSSDDSVPNFRT